MGSVNSLLNMINRSVRSLCDKHSHSCPVILFTYFIKMHVFISYVQYSPIISSVWWKNTWNNVSALFPIAWLSGVVKQNMADFHSNPLDMNTVISHSQKKNNNTKKHATPIACLLYKSEKLVIRVPSWIGKCRLFRYTFAYNTNRKNDNVSYSPEPFPFINSMYFYRDHSLLVGDVGQW